MGNVSAFEQIDCEILFCEFSDEALEVQANKPRETTIGNITLYYCTALYFCPGP
jgi:hypothetical protein